MLKAIYDQLAREWRLTHVGFVMKRHHFNALFAKVRKSHPTPSLPLTHPLNHPQAFEIWVLKLTENLEKKGTNAVVSAFEVGVGGGK